MATLNAPGLTAAEDVNFSLADAEYDFANVDGNTFSGSFYSYITSGGHDINLNGSGFTFSGTQIVGGNVTSITVDLDDDGGSDFTISGLNADAGELNGTTAEFVAEVFGGDDTITTGNGADFIKGVGGEDTISTGNGNDTIVGGNGRSTLDGGAGNDSIAGGSENDLIRDGLGNDTVDAGGGNDRVIEGFGIDDI
ncbi:MAG: calcium-binding protein, partial [Pseudomonadota bacterium]